MSDDILELEIQPSYIGSAYTPQVEVTETSGGHNVAITYDDADTGITTVDFEVLDGEQGPQGETGPAAGFGAVSASIDDEVGTPSVTVTTGGPDTAKTFSFAFHNMKGETGDAAGFGAVSASVDANVGTPSVTVTSGGPDTAKTLDFAFKNLKGNKGDTGDAAGFGSPTASVDSNVGTPSVAVTSSGPNTAKVFDFAFHNMKGQTGAAAGFGTVSATVDDSTGTPSVEVTTSGEDTAKNFAFAFHNLKGAQGEPGDVQADGAYPLLRAGLADALASSYGEIATFAQRTSTRNGAMEIASLLGNTVRWNQYANLTPSVNSSTVTVNGTRITATSLSGNHVYFGIMLNASTRIPFNKVGHLILLSFDIVDINITEEAQANFGYIAVAAPQRTVTGNPSSWSETTGHVANRIQIVSVANAAAYIYLNAVFTASTDTTGCSFTIDNLQVFDLTEAFSAGNEPTTVAEFEAQYPDDYYPYDAGSLQSVNVAGITSAGNTLEIPASTYFPNGLRSAGTAHDALYRDHADTVIGVVDLGTQSWTYNPTYYYFYCDLASRRVVENNIAIAEYTVISGSLDGNQPDKSIKASGSNNRVFITDRAYTDAAAFKTAMSGVMLYYELATPTTTPIDPPLNLTYPVEAGGTESIIVPTGSTSAAPTFVTLYAYDADGIIDKTQSIIAQVESGTASTNYAVNSYLVMRGTLYRVTSAIATGENISPGTNCTATTVMAEVIRLTT